MAHKKGEGSTSNGLESHSKRLGVKISGGALAIAGNIIVRQRGTNFHPGNGVGIGKDHTIYAMADGIVEFRRKKNERYYINILPLQSEPVEAKEKTSKKKAMDRVPVETVTTEVEELSPRKKVKEAPVETATDDVAEEKPRKRKKVETEPEAEN